MHNQVNLWMHAKDHDLKSTPTGGNVKLAEERKQAGGWAGPNFKIVTLKRGIGP